MRTFFEGTEYQREEVTPEIEGNVSSDAIPADLVVIN